MPRNANAGYSGPKGNKRDGLNSAARNAARDKLDSQSGTGYFGRANQLKERLKRTSMGKAGQILRGHTGGGSGEREQRQNNSRWGSGKERQAWNDANK